MLDFSWCPLVKNPESFRESLIADLVDNCRDKGKLKDILKQADFGINDVTVKEIELSETQIEMMRKMSSISSERSAFEDETTSSSPMHMKALGFMHSATDGEPRTLPYHLESRGTQVFLTLLLPALEALSEGSFLVIDELDTSLHPDLSRALLSLFGRKTSNPYGAQFLFSTHDVTLLDSDVLQQDEIWFTEKDSDGASRLTPLTDFKLPPPDQLKHGDIEQAYRLGRFGGVPSSREFLVELDTDQGEEEK
ncbi:MAG: ATP-binding protein [Synechococcus sp. SB0669_bin_8]|nr:ATP-binding protein [Synechococcus sp. SB0669_bin_8]